MRLTTRQYIGIFPICFGCRRAMAFVESFRMAPNYQEVVYKCPECRFGFTNRTIRRCLVLP